MKKILWTVSVFLTALAFFHVAEAAVTYPINGGTGSSSLTGIIVGNGMNPVNTLTIGNNLTLTGTTLSASGGSGGSGNVSTSSAETATFIPWWTSTAATPALLSGGSSSFEWLNPGLIAAASSTIGGGTAVTGLTINGTATTTGTAYFGDKIYFGPCQALGRYFCFSGSLANKNVMGFQNSASNGFDGITAYDDSGTAQFTLAYGNSGTTVAAGRGIVRLASNDDDVSFGNTFATISGLLLIASSTGHSYVGVEGTTTPGSPFSINNIANFDVATSTFYTTGGINLEAGCFAINGTCIGGGSGGGTPSGSTNTIQFNAGGGSFGGGVSTYLDAASGYAAYGTTTPQFGLLTLGTSTAPQLLLTDNTSGDNLFAFRTIGNYLFLATSTATATSSNSILGINATDGTFNVSASSTSFGPPGSNGLNAALTIVSSSTADVSGLRIVSSPTTLGLQAVANGANPNVTFSGMTNFTLNPGSVMSITSGAAATFGTQNNATVSFIQENTSKMQLLRGQDLFTPNASSNQATTNFQFTGPAMPSVPTTAEQVKVNFNLSQTSVHVAGNVTKQREFYIQAPTEAFASNVASTSFGRLSLMDLSGAPLLGNWATSTENDTLYLEASALNASTTNSYGLVVNANTGANQNYSGEFLGGTLLLGAGFAMTVNEQASSYTVATSTDSLIAITSTASPRTVTLPFCSNNATTSVNTNGNQYTIKDESGAAATNNITIQGVSSQTIDGASTKVISTNYGVAHVYCDAQGGVTAAWFTQ